MREREKRRGENIVGVSVSKEKRGGEKLSEEDKRNERREVIL